MTRIEIVIEQPGKDKGLDITIKARGHRATQVESTCAEVLLLGIKKMTDEVEKNLIHNKLTNG
jgi:hypothetical protein